MNRADLQRLADDRAADAAALLAAGRWSAAYYLAGYAVECALKACIARRVQAGDFPDKQLTNESYTHDVVVLTRTAQLTAAVAVRAKASRAFADHWNLARDWDESARYKQWPEQTARDLFQAVTDAQNGILPWLRTYW